MLNCVVYYSIFGLVFFCLMRKFIFTIIVGLIVFAFSPAAFAQDGRYYEKALDAYEENDLDIAERYFKLEVESNPDNGYAWYGLGLVYIDRYNSVESDSSLSYVEMASESFDKALEAVPADDLETLCDICSDRIEMAMALNDLEKLLEVCDKYVLYAKNSGASDHISYSFMTRAVIYQSVSLGGDVDIEEALPYIVSDISDALISDESAYDFEDYLDLFVEEEPSYELYRSYRAIHDMLTKRLDESEDLEDMLNRCIDSLEKKWAPFRKAIAKKVTDSEHKAESKSESVRSESSKRAAETAAADKAAAESSASATRQARTIRIPFKTVYGMRQVDCSVDSRKQVACYRPDVSGIRITVLMANNILSGAASSGIKVGSTVTLPKCVIGGISLGNVKATVVENLHPALEFGPGVFGKGAKVSIDDSSKVLIITR